MHSQTRIRNQFSSYDGLEFLTRIRNQFFTAMMELEIWAKRVELRWHAMIWLKIPSWIPRWLPYTFRTYFKCSWNDTRSSNLQKHALHCHMLLQWPDLKLFCILPMQWYDHKDPMIWNHEHCIQSEKLLSKPLMHWLMTFQFPNLHLIWSQRSLVKSNHEKFYLERKAAS